MAESLRLTRRSGEAPQPGLHSCGRQTHNLNVLIEPGKNRRWAQACTYILRRHSRDGWCGSVCAVQWSTNSLLQTL